MFTPSEKEFLIELLKTLTINPAAPNASAIVEQVQTILTKLSEEGE